VFVTLTRWFVITGSPCCGKTTVIRELERRGYKCSPEVARLHIESQLANGLTIAEMRKDEMAFQRSLIASKVSLEEGLNPNEIVFMDRAMPDSMSYFKLKGFEPSEIMQLSLRFRYAGILLFDRLPFEEDGVRVEDEQAAAFLDKQLELDYRSLGYDVTRIPAMSVQDRVTMLLSLTSGLLADECSRAPIN
jgi:predicted ATPase